MYYTVKGENKQNKYTLLQIKVLINLHRKIII